MNQCISISLWFYILEWAEDYVIKECVYAYLYKKPKKNLLIIACYTCCNVTHNKRIFCEPKYMPALLKLVRSGDAFRNIKLPYASLQTHPIKTLIYGSTIKY